jgi:hypothetical protein
VTIGETFDYTDIHIYTTYWLSTAVGVEDLDMAMAGVFIIDLDVISILTVNLSSSIDFGLTKLFCEEPSL